MHVLTAREARANFYRLMDETSNGASAAVQDEPARLLLKVLSLGREAIERGEFSDAEDVFARLDAMPEIGES